MSIEAMKQWLECAERCESLDGNYSWADVVSAIKEAIEQAEVANNDASQHRVDETAKQEHEQEPVAELTDDEIYDAAYATFCRGPNTRELFRMMWMCNPPCSIGWDRNKLKAFARHIASLYTSPPPRQPLSDERIAKEVEAELTHYWNGGYIDTTGARDQLTAFARSIEAAHNIKGEA